MASKSMFNQIAKQRNRHINYAKNIVLNHADAEDIVQDCYLTLMHKIEDLNNRTQNLNAYFMQTIRNRCLDFLKKNQSIDFLDHKHILQINHQTPDVLLQIKQELNQLEIWMQQLPEKQRSVFYLRDIEGFELKEIQDAMQMSNEAVRANLSRARKKIKEIYQNHTQ